MRTRGPGLCTGAVALKTPCVRACARAPAACPAAKGAGGGAAPRPGLTCLRSPLPFLAADRARSYSCPASERPDSVVPRPKHVLRYGNNQTLRFDCWQNWDSGWHSSSSPKFLVPLPPGQTHPPSGASICPEPNHTPCACHVMQGSPITFSPLSLVFLLATWPSGKRGG